jgi:hypothetical protein
VDATREERLKELRKQFPPESVGKLPRVTCQACSKAQAKVCSEHRKSKCAECGNYITSAHMHLDYVGHAEVTDRLLNVDPNWNWEPFALDAQGLPALDRDGNLWIRLTIDGVTRPGVGDGPDMKQRISDAIRNGAMRFGVALNLWAKSELESQHDETPTATVRPAAEPAAPRPGGAGLCPLCNTSLGDGRAVVRFNGEFVHSDCKSNAMADVPS